MFRLFFEYTDDNESSIMLLADYSRSLSSPSSSLDKKKSYAVTWLVVQLIYSA